MTTLATRFRAFPSTGVDVGEPATVDATLRSTPFDATVDAEPSRPRVVDASVTNVDGARYAVLSVLGRGGMGEVRLCRDSRIGRDVAIKVAHGGDDGIRARFLRESRVQGQLEHPAIVPVYDLEIFDDGSAYFAMKRVRGLTLATILEHLRKGDAEMAKRFPQRKLLAAFNSVCLAVDFAHTKGVVHRDIKPGNIMLGDFGEVYLLDWGLAKLLATTDEDEPTLRDALPSSSSSDETVVGSLLGTPGYMAPEQIDASIAPILPAADVYALGAVLFEIVAGVRYVEGADYVEATIATLQGRERRPSKRAPAERAANIAPALDDICARALARTPAERYASARELYDAVDAHLAGEHDLERRRALSVLHLDNAAKQADTDAGRAAALQELGSALALDPENAAARRELVRLLTTSPSATPPEVQARIEDDERKRIREIARLRARSGLSFLPFVPISFLLGVIDLVVIAATFASMVGSSIFSALLVRSPRTSVALQVVAHALFLFGCVGASRLAGPFILVPGFLIAYAVELQSHPRAAQRLGVVVAACLTMVAIFGIEMSGLVEPAYAIVDGGLLIRSHLVELTGGALWFLLAATIVNIITPSLFASGIRGALVDAQKKLHLQAWQLAQLVPQDAPKDQRTSA